ncbi:hypothetical protein ACLQ24_21775 [Micromonospora sp. DT4]|uniref:hypothetical protein n=1 Tax=Micromonospora sp. DT4 TaxID=3393438 RepID=UPI003CEF4EAE
MTAIDAPPAPALNRDRRFRTFWIGQMISAFGDRISELALPLIAVALLAATPVQVSVLTALIWLPNLLGLSAGAIGVAFGIGALGGLAGAALASRVSHATGVGPTAMIGAVVFPAPLALTALIDGPTWAKIAMLAAVELGLLASPVRHIRTLDIVTP